MRLSFVNVFEYQVEEMQFFSQEFLFKTFRQDTSGGRQGAPAGRTSPKVVDFLTKAVFSKKLPAQVLEVPGPGGRIR